MKKFNRNAGITLIALVITIIVLLILAGVTIAAISGDNGILKNAARAKEETEQAEKDEREKLGDMEDTIKEYVTGIEIEQVTDIKPGELETDETDANTYIINSIEDLVVFASDVRNGNTYEGKTVKLGLSLDFNSNKSYVDPLRTDYGEYGYDGELKTLLTTGEGFKPIGSSNLTIKNYFHGTFDGNNNSIYNLYITLNTKQAEDTVLGFFSTNQGIIQNINLYNININVPEMENEISVYLGGISGTNSNNISNCYVNGKMINRGKQWSVAGGVCGILGNATIENCINETTIIVENNSTEGNAVAGGIAGQSNNEGIINACCNKGTIKADGKENLTTCIGGIIGYSRSEVKNCYNTGNIEGISNIRLNIGGIAGATEEGKKVLNSYNIGEVKSEGNTNVLYQGGIVGYNYANSISNVFNYGNINVQAHLTQETDNRDFRVGGIACGTFVYTIENAYNVGNIINDNEVETIGSIVGLRWEAILDNCNYLKETYSKGIGFLHDENDTMEGVTELENMSDFPNILDVINGEGMFKEDTNNINNGYPILNWQ